MAEEHTLRVIVERKKGAGCGTFLGVLILVGLTIEYWYVALAILAVVVVVGVAVNSQQREKEPEKRHRRGPRDPWLNEVAVTLADLGLTEVARNTGGQLGGVALEGDIGVQDERLLVYVNLFSDAERARRAEIGLRADPKIREAIASGCTVLKAEDRVLCVANGRGGVVDEFRLDDLTRAVGRVTVPAPLEAPASAKAEPPTSAAMRSALQASPSGADALEQIRKLGELREAGVLTEGEFEAKKSELLQRV